MNIAGGSDEEANRVHMAAVDFCGDGIEKLRRKQNRQKLQPFVGPRRSSCDRRSDARRIKVVFRFFCCAAIFSVLLFAGSKELGWKHACPWCAE